MTAVQLGDLTFFQAVLQAKNVPLALLLLHAYWPKLDLTKRIQPTVTAAARIHSSTGSKGPAAFEKPRR